MQHSPQGLWAGLKVLLVFSSVTETYLLLGTLVHAGFQHASSSGHE
jgi:hypothetical protein